MEVAGWLLFAVVLFHAGPALVLVPRRTLRRLSARCPEPENLPKLSVIIAARDEEARIRETLTRLLASDYPSLEIILANDRSTDRTGSIATEIAATDERLQVVPVESLPDGWLGKTNAMSLAAARSTGEWLLFTDGDIHFAADTLRLSMAYTLDRKLDHFCLLPSMETEGWLECVLVSFFAMLFTFGTLPWLRSIRFPLAYYGVGAFNLVRRETYEAIGGHESIRLDVMDDVKLGKLLFRHRATADCLAAGDAVQVRWQTSTWQVIRGLEKNAFASMRYSWTRLALFSLIFCCVFFVPIPVSAMESPRTTTPFVVTLVLLHVSFARLSTTFGGTIAVFPGLIIGAAGMLFAFWRSAWLTTIHKGVTWRDSFYPLETLRKNEYR